MEARRLPCCCFSLEGVLERLCLGGRHARPGRLRHTTDQEEDRNQWRRSAARRHNHRQSWGDCLGKYWRVLDMQDVAHHTCPSCNRCQLAPARKDRSQIEESDHAKVRQRY